MICDYFSSVVKLGQYIFFKEYDDKLVNCMSSKDPFMSDIGRRVYFSYEIMTALLKMSLYLH
jgi:hypothetical protein